ncbi:zinc finger bed domain-containing protein ricesleeper 2-like [Gigaspora margarita]|uniref:Zinc finger bed domain-containing protein ricesleeper 2-like n=1 Tax=Gigaspora margarita TaxID=4874 RepID=A0A8H4A4R6_GIGMA|nr:zinc finger bed domain-containing protein ricesleeper 2-like [Gigaspora margarita]
MVINIIDESSNTSKSIWDYFNKVKNNNKVIAKCKHCKNAKYSITNDTTTNLWRHLKKMHNSFLGVSTSQSTLDKFNTKHIENKNISNEFTEESFRQWMAEWIIFEDLPFTIIEGHFKSIIERALKIKVVSADTIQRNILQKYSQIHNNIHQELQASSKLAFILDIWTSISIIGITTDNASNNNTIIDNIELWAIEKILTFSDKNHFRCFAHVLNLAVQAGLKHLKEEIEQIRNIILKCHSSSQR